jgi:squalene-hopene/tetraprenyl-beta-curcumene cyclase
MKLAHLLCWTVVALLPFASVAPVSAADEPALPKVYSDSVTQALQYLRTEGQAENGSFSAQAGPAITAIVATAALRHGLTESDPMVAKAIGYVKQFVQEDGGIYAPNSRVKNYETSISIQMFAAANKDGKYDDLLAKSEKFIKDLQWTGEEGHDESSAFYGGQGYGGHARPDLSNTTFFLDALQALGKDENDEAVQRALVFVSRTQNLESEHNTMPFAAKVNDGGFYYTPANGGESQAGKTEDGGLRSYASMTYAGLKSMIFAGVDKDDPRVKAAYDWVRMHYTLDENPGMDQQGLYYYYMTFAKALNAIGNDKLVATNGEEHDWRADLIRTLAQRQRTDGSWANETPRWLEGDKNLATAYALLALDYARGAVTSGQ